MDHHSNHCHSKASRHQGRLAINNINTWGIETFIQHSYKDQLNYTCILILRQTKYQTQTKEMDIGLEVIIHS